MRWNKSTIFCSSNPKVPTFGFFVHNSFGNSMAGRWDFSRRGDFKVFATSIVSIGTFGATPLNLERGHIEGITYIQGTPFKQLTPERVNGGSSQCLLPFRNRNHSKWAMSFPEPTSFHILCWWRYTHHHLGLRNYAPYPELVWTYPPKSNSESSSRHIYLWLVL